MSSKLFGKYNFGFGDLAISGDVTLLDDNWIGLGASSARLVFDDLATDLIKLKGGNLDTEGNDIDINTGNLVVNNGSDVTLSAAELAYLDGQDQAVGSNDSPTFADLTLTGGATGAGQLLFGGASSVSVELGRRLEAQWNMNDDAADTDVVDATGNGYTGTAQQNTDGLTTTGNINAALTFNGTSDFIDTNATFQSIVRNGFSIAQWVKPDDGIPASAMMLFGQRDAVGDDSTFYCRIDTEGKLDIAFQSEGNLANRAIADSACFSDGAEGWHLVVCTFDPTVSGVGGLKIYLDGSEVTLDASNNGSTAGVDFSEYTSNKNLYIGARNNNGADDIYFDGDIDCTMLFSRVLTEADATAIYNSGSGTEDISSTTTSATSLSAIASSSPTGAHLSDAVGSLLIEDDLEVQRFTYLNNDITISDTRNIILNTTTGSQIGTGASQKLGFWGTTPVVQQSHITDAPGDTTANNATTINSILTALETVGILASS